MMVFKRPLLTMALLSACSTGMAEPATEAADLKDALTGGKFSGNFRLRYEYADQAGFNQTAEAFTLRSVLGYETKALHGFSINAQVYGVSPLNDDYNDAKKGAPIASRTQYPTIADPEDYDFQQLYIQFKNASHQVKLGRQALILDNWRFVGDVRFRQNWQVMNGLSYVNTSLADTTITAAHFDQVKQINTKIQDADIDILHAKYALTAGTSLSGYGYWLGWDGRALEVTSSKTFGARLNGAEKISDDWKLLFTAEYAQQDNYKNGNRNIDNDYYWLGGGLDYHGWYATLNQEKLSGNSNGVAFQTPLGTNHIFNGWTDLFSTTPAEGLDDTILMVGGQLLGATIKAEYHLMNADRHFNKAGGGTGNQYGKELDIGVYYPFSKQFTGSIEYGNFKEGDIRAAGRKRDAEKIWLTASYSF